MTADVGRPGLAPDGFRLGRLLGRGGSGTVHEARHAATGRSLALKMLTVDVADPSALRLFERERTVMADLATHPNVVSIVDAGVLGGRPWIAMDLCRRGSLAGSGPLPVEAVTTTLAAVAAALTAAHARGVIHCDVKPANLLVTDFGQVALGDFGVARLALGSGTGATAGGYTLDHVAPEVVDGAHPTDRTDVYSLGTTAWQLLCGRPPFRRSGDTSAGAVLYRIRSEPLPPLDRPDVPAPLAALIAHMTAKAPGDRPSPADVAAALDRIARTHGLSTSAPMGEVLTIDDDVTDLMPSWAHEPSHPGRSLPAVGMPGVTDHRPDPAGLTYGGRPVALAAVRPVLASVNPGRRDPVLLAAVVGVCVVVLACGGLVTARLTPSGAAAAVVTTATGEQQVVPAGVTPPGSATPIDDATGAPVLVSADHTSTRTGPVAGRANAVAGAPGASAPLAPPTTPAKPVTDPTPKPSDAHIYVIQRCQDGTSIACSLKQGEIYAGMQVLDDKGEEASENCIDNIRVQGPSGVVYADSRPCNQRGPHALPLGAGSEGQYSIYASATIAGKKLAQIHKGFSVTS